MEPDDDALWCWSGEAVPYSSASNYNDGYFGPGRSVVVQWFQGETYFYKAGDFTRPHPAEWYDCQLVLKAPKVPLRMKSNVIEYLMKKFIRFCIKHMINRNQVGKVGSHEKFVRLIANETKVTHYNGITKTMQKRLSKYAMDLYKEAEATAVSEWPWAVVPLQFHKTLSGEQEASLMRGHLDRNAPV